MDEREAIERLQRGDVGALEPLVRRYQVRAVRTAYLVARDLTLAQDVVQAAFVKAYERIGQFDTRRAFGPWFLTSVLRDAIKAARRRDRQISLDALLGEQESDPTPQSRSLPGDQLGPEALWEQAETAQAVWAALGKLVPEQRAAVVSRYFLGLSEAEMAAALVCPPSTIKWRLHAARQRLRLLLRPMMPVTTETAD